MMSSRPNEPKSPLRLGTVSPKPSKSRSRPAWKISKNIRRVLGLPKTLTVGTTRYRERCNTPVHRALGPGGSGVKEYDVRFGRNGRTMRIRMTNERQYADLGPSVRSSSYSRLASLIRPGDRILEISCGTGDGSALLAELAGPSGALIALTHDRESVRFARERYPGGTVGFELGGIESLAGEIDGAFDRVIWSMPCDLDGFAELARVVRTAGLLIVLVRRRDAELFESKNWKKAAQELFDSSTLQGLGGTTAIILSRSDQPHPDSTRHHG